MSLSLNLNIYTGEFKKIVYSDEYRYSSKVYKSQSTYFFRQRSRSDKSADGSCKVSSMEDLRCIYNSHNYRLRSLKEFNDLFMPSDRKIMMEISKNEFLLSDGSIIQSESDAALSFLSKVYDYETLHKTVSLKLKRLNEEIECFSEEDLVKVVRDSIEVVIHKECLNLAKKELKKHRLSKSAIGRYAREIFKENRQILFSMSSRDRESLIQTLVRDIMSSKEFSQQSALQQSPSP